MMNNFQRLFVILAFYGARSLDCPQCFHAAWRESGIPETYRANIDSIITNNTNYPCAHNEVPARPCPAGWNNTCGTASLWFTGKHFPYYAPDADVNLEMVSRFCLLPKIPESCVSINNESMLAGVFIAGSPDDKLIGVIADYIHGLNDSEYLGQFCHSKKGLPVQLHIDDITSGGQNVISYFAHLTLALTFAKAIQF